ncbi:MAG: hypothetical protein EBR01_09795 [Proteobacteria bacterium]|nr:hypothetical protein [Pseudomonadota bacterium]
MPHLVNLIAHNQTIHRGFLMFEKETSVNNVVQFKSKKKQDPMWDKLMKDQDVKDFFKFVYENDLRLAALEALKMRLANSN